ncbi:PAS domain-containing protein [Massilia sp. BSC265]|uniref:PAS domain-containing protein n=1 Tax=Massilia sp. BSC265 TaxID=1549812 RepID=UPI00068BC3BA|nr:PAS domain-containing protein [Massilia sp. BSC265]
MKIDTHSVFPDSDVSHIVRFYADDAPLLAEVAGFIDRALAAPGTGIVIATASHCAGIRDLLAAPSGVVFLDAKDTLAQLLVDGWPDEPRFRAVLGPLLSNASASAGPIHIFVEMAALLCAQGRYQAALRLEQLLNCLCADYRLTFFCAYPWRVFPDAAQAQVFEDICGEHGHACGSTVHGVNLDLKGRSLEQARREQMEIALGGEASGYRQEQGPGNAVEGMHHVGPDGTILWADRAELQMLGYRWEEYVGRHIANFHVDVEMVDLILDTLLSGGVLVDQPARLRCKDGTIRHVQMCSSSCFEDGRLRYSACITRDDTKRNESAGVLTQRDRLLLNSPIAVALFMAPDLRFRLANRHFCDLFGRRELVGKRLVEALPQLRYSEVEAALEHVFETGQPWCGRELGLVLPNADGMPEERFFKIDLEALYQASGKRHGVMAVVVDVTGSVRTRRLGILQPSKAQATAGQARDQPRQE